MNQSCCSLGFLSQNSLWKLSTFRGYKGIYSRVCEECEKSFFYKTGGSGNSLSQLGQVASFNHEIMDWLDCLFLSCSAPAVMTLQLPACFTCVALWWIISHESFVSSSRENALDCTHTWILHTLSHTSLTWFHLKTGYLIVELQANLAWNKANTWLNKFNLTKVKEKSPKVMNVL